MHFTFIKGSKISVMHPLAKFGFFRAKPINRQAFDALTRKKKGGKSRTQKSTAKPKCRCSYCGCILRADRLEKHVSKVHLKELKQSSVGTTPNTIGSPEAHPPATTEKILGWLKKT
jgi:hypothetical protein